MGAEEARDGDGRNGTSADPGQPAYPGQVHSAKSAARCDGISGLLGRERRQGIGGYAATDTRSFLSGQRAVPTSDHGHGSPAFCRPREEGPLRQLQVEKADHACATSQLELRLKAPGEGAQNDRGSLTDGGGFLPFTCTLPYHTTICNAHT